MYILQKKLILNKNAMYAMWYKKNSKTKLK